MHKTKVSNISPPTRRRSALPEVGDIENLLSQNRNLRLEFVRLTSYEPLTESARGAVDALVQVSLAGEKIAELLVSTRSRRQRSHHKTIPPIPKDPTDA